MADKMTSARREVLGLLTLGTMGQMTDGQLLDRFLARRDEGAEIAFEELIARHGPMVLRVCRAVLRDSHDAEDAFQAAFLVLVHRAGAIQRATRLQAGSSAWPSAWRPTRSSVQPGCMQENERRRQAMARATRPCMIRISSRHSRKRLPAFRITSGQQLPCVPGGFELPGPALRLGVSEVTVRGRLVSPRNHGAEGSSAGEQWFPATLMVAGEGSQAQGSFLPRWFAQPWELLQGFITGNTASLLRRRDPIDVPPPIESRCNPPYPRTPAACWPCIFWLRTGNGQKTPAERAVADKKQVEKTAAGKDSAANIA